MERYAHTHAQLTSRCHLSTRQWKVKNAFVCMSGVCRCVSHWHLSLVQSLSDQESHWDRSCPNHGRRSNVIRWTLVWVSRRSRWIKSNSNQKWCLAMNEWMLITIWERSHRLVVRKQRGNVEIHLFDLKWDIDWKWSEDILNPIHFYMDVHSNSRWKEIRSARLLHRALKWLTHECTVVKCLFARSVPAWLSYTVSERNVRH